MFCAGADDGFFVIDLEIIFEFDNSQVKKAADDHRIPKIDNVIK